MSTNQLLHPNLLSLFKTVFTPGHQDSTFFSKLGHIGNLYLHPKKNDVTQFWREYCILAENDEIICNEGDDEIINDRARISLAEKPGQEMPVIAEAQLIFDKESLENSDPYYETNIDIDIFMYCFIYAYQSVLNEYFSTDTHQKIAVILQPDFYVHNSNDNFVVDFRIQFPYWRVDSSYISKIIIPKVIEKLRSINAFSYLPVQPLNDWNDIINDTIASKPVSMYRSVNSLNEAPYSIRDVIGRVDLEDIEEGNEIDTIPLDNGVFNVTTHKDYQNSLIDAGIFEEHDDDDRPYDHIHWLPLFLSLNFFQNTTSLNNKGFEFIKNSQPVNRTDPADIDASQETPLEIGEYMLNYIDKVTWKKYHYWVCIGKCIYNIYDNKNEGYSRWVNLTQNKTDFDSQLCKGLWKKFSKNNTYTHKTLAYLARQDNREAYEEWHLRWCKPFFTDALQCTHTDVARALNRYYWLDYICADPESKLWYKYNGIRWTKIRGASAIRNQISNDFVKQFEKLRSVLSTDIQRVDSPDQKAIIENSINRAGKVIKCLKNVSFKNSIMRESADIFYEGNEDFLSYLDDNPDLFVSRNAVIELNDIYAAVRTGIPEDFVSKLAGTVYEKLGWDNEYVKMFMKWMNQCFKYADLRDYFLKLLSSCLRSRNSEKIFPILTGAKNNSKSMIKKMTEAVWGSYCITMPLEILTTKRQSSSGPSPELARADKTKLAWFQEPDTEDKLNNGNLKVFTGGDSFFARFCNNDGGDVTSTFVPLMMCNKIPVIPGSDDAVKERWRVLPFDSTWVSKEMAPDTEEEQNRQRIYPKDPFFENEIPFMAPAALFVFVEMYTVYARDGLTQPSRVTFATENYWNNNDIYGLFSEECIEMAYKPGYQGEIDRLLRIHKAIKGKNEDEDDEQIDEDMKELYLQYQDYSVKERAKLLKETTRNINSYRDYDSKMTIGEVYKLFNSWYKNGFGNNAPQRSTMVKELGLKWGNPVHSKWGGIKPREGVANAEAFF